MRASFLPLAGRSSFGHTRAKRRPRAALAAIAVAALSGTASAALNIYEPFNYSAGALQGNTNSSSGTTANGNLWQRAGIGNPPANINVTSGSLTGPAELPPSVGNGLTLSSGDGSTNRLALDQNYVTSGLVYYSFLLDVTDLTGVNNTTGAFFFSLNNSADVSQTNNPTVVPGKVQVRADAVDPTKYNLGIFGQAGATAGSAAWATNQLSLSTTQVIVGSLNLATKETRMWINPDPSSFGLATAPTPTASLTDPTVWSGNNIQSVLVRQGSGIPILRMDELRVGSSWGEVTPTLSSYWDIDGATAGAGGATPGGTWDGATSNWSASAAGDAATTTWPGGSYKAVFSAGTDATGTYTVTVTGTQSAASLGFEEGTVTLTGGTVNLSTGVIDAGTGVTARIESTIGSTSGLSKNGTGTVVLPGSMSYTGNTTINAGTLQIGDGGTTGALPTSSAITNNGTLVFNRSDTVTQGTEFSGSGMSGTGHLTQAGSGNLILNVPNTFTGVTKATAGTLTVTDSLALQNSTVDTTGAGSIVFDNALTSASVGGLQGATAYTHTDGDLSITVGNNVRNAAYSAAITGTGSFTKVGTTAQELTGVNTYSGGTNVNAGVLQFGPTNSMPASGAVAVNNGGTLSVHVSGAGEWTNGTTGVGSLGGLIAGDGGQTASQVTWNDGSSLGINTDSGEAVTYSGNIGSFNVVSDLTKSVGLTKRGQGSLTLTGTNTFRGQLQVDNDGGTVMLTATQTNAGQSMSIPTVNIGNAGGTNAITDGSRDTGIKVLTNDALPTNSLISFGSSVGGNDAPSSLLQLYDGFALIGNLPGGPSFNQTVRGITGASGRVKTGLGTLTIDVPTGESYSSGGTLRTDYQDASVHGKVIKTGPGRQDFNQANGNFNGDFILQQGTVGAGTANVFGAAANSTARLILNGGTLMNTVGGALSLNVPNVDIGGSVALDVNGSANAQFLNSTINLTVPNPTITVIPAQSGTSGVFIFLAKVTDNGAGHGFTKAGAGILNLSPSGMAGPNSYTGDTTIQEGSLRVVEFSQIGDAFGNSDVNLSGGQLEFNGTGATNARLFNVINPVHVTANSGIAYGSTLTGLTDVTDPNGIVFEFSNSAFDRSGGTLTFQHQGSSQGITFRPRFSSSGFDYAGPVVISNGGGTRKTVLESTNTTGTQTWSGDITGDGSYSRGTGGNTVFAGQLVSVGGVTIADNSKIQLAQSPGSDRVIRTANLTIGSTNSRLDLTNNKLITATPAGTWNGTNYTDVAGLVDSGRGSAGNAMWDGTTGIVTSDTRAINNGDLVSIGVAKVSEVRTVADTETTTFAGQTVLGSDTLAMATWGGDANLDGKINIDDYGRIDGNVGQSGTVFGWSKGDFNYDGKINIDDYGIIDGNINRQGAAFPTGSGAGGAALEGVAAVPEPASLSLVALGALGLMRRRRRSH